jgi:hypothetical protein
VGAHGWLPTRGAIARSGKYSFLYGYILGRALNNFITLCIDFHAPLHFLVPLHIKQNKENKADYVKTRHRSRKNL